MCMSIQVISAPISQYDVENGRSACTCICLEAALQTLREFANGVWAGTSESVAVSLLQKRMSQKLTDPGFCGGHWGHSILCLSI